jgi:hypothetical protein
MDVRSFKNSDIDRLNEEQMNTDDEPTMDCARCGRRGLGEGQVCIREWEGDSDAPMCAPCWDTTEEEEDLQFAMENGAELLGEDPIVYEDPDKVSAELVEDEKEVYGVCDCCGMEGKFFGEEGDDWTCPTCAYGNCSCDNTSDEEGGEELLVCLYCGKDENECEKNKEGEKNPITVWCGGWGMSCDDCYYKNHPESDEEDEEDPVCCNCGEESDQKGNPNSKVQLYDDGEWYCGRCYEYQGRCEDCGEKDTDECRPDCPYQIKAQIKHLLYDLDRVEGRGGVQRFITEELRYLFLKTA